MSIIVIVGCMGGTDGRKEWELSVPIDSLSYSIRLTTGLGS